MNATTPITALLRAIDEASSAEAMVDAVEKLSVAGLTEAIPTLIAVLGYNNPGAAVAAVEGLIELGEKAVVPLLDLLDGYNYGARAWAIRALAGIGDPRGLAVLLEATRSDFALSVRRAAARGLGLLQWHQLSPEQRERAQADCLEVLLGAAQDPEWVVRYAAITGLQNLGLASGQSQDHSDALVIVQLQNLYDQEPVLAVQARIRLAQHQLQHPIGPKHKICP